MRIDFEKWAVFAPKENTGCGRMADDMKVVLGCGAHVIADSYHMANRPPIGDGEKALAREATRAEVEECFSDFRDLQGVFFFERFDWNRHFLSVCRSLGIKTVCIPTWEWFTGWLDSWRDCDLFVCPSRFAEEIVSGFGYENTAHLPWTLDLAKLPRRVVDGPARTFVHNAGLVDAQDRKATRDTIMVFRKLKRKDIRLVVRAQREAVLPELDEGIEVRIGNLAEPSELYLTGDVAIQPSKMEGIGFMVLEAVCSGLPTVTLDYPPMNTYVRQPEMLVSKRLFKRKAFPTQWVPHAHLRLPNLSNLATKIEWCADNEMGPLSRENRRWAEETFSSKRLREQWKQVLEENL